MFTPRTPPPQGLGTPQEAGAVRAHRIGPEVDEDIFETCFRWVKVDLEQLSPFMEEDDDAFDDEE